MVGTYPILLGSEVVGQAEVKKQGLYYLFSCRCQLTGEVIYRIKVICGEHSESLGIPVPEGRQFTLQAKIPASRFGEGEPSFRLVPRHPIVGGSFIPLAPETPFPYLKRLERAYLAKQDGQLGIIFREES